MDSAEQRDYHSGSDYDLDVDCEKASDIDNNGDVLLINNKLDISQEQADKNYEAAGREVNEEEVITKRKLILMSTLSWMK